MNTLTDYLDDGPIAATLRGWLPRISTLGVLLALLPGTFAFLSTAVELSSVIGSLVLFAIVAICARPGTTPVSWLTPPLVRIAEYGTVIGCAAAFQPEAYPAAFAFLAALAFHHYDTVYRLRHLAVPPPRWLRYSLGGWEIRMGAVLALTATGNALPWLWILAVWVGVLSVGESISCWRSASAVPLRDLVDIGGD